MILCKEWQTDWKGAGTNRVKYYYKGWFLFGILPLYITRITQCYI